MANPTTNFGWQMPTATDLVTDLPADFEVFGQAVDTDFVGLLGGTTGQVLAKASGTDLDFVWSADAAGMTNPMTTTADIIYSSSGSTPARLGIGSNADVLTVAGGVPTWAAPAAGGGMTLLSTTALSGATTITVSSISQDYTNLLVSMNAFYSSSASNFYVKFNNANLTTWTGNRNVDGTSANFNSGSSVNSIDNGWSIYAGTAGTSDGTVATSYVLEIPNYSDTSGQKAFTMYGGGVTAGSTNYSTSIMSGRYAGNTGINRLDFTMSSNFATGTVKIWGIK
jgi:hypothetical protein